jgi:hypothetical protein
MNKYSFIFYSIENKQDKLPKLKHTDDGLFVIDDDFLDKIELLVGVAGHSLLDDDNEQLNKDESFLFLLLLLLL